jgi:hypothetical protein
MLAWKRAVGVGCLLLALQVSLPAHADDCTGPAPPNEQVESLPPPGTCRLIRIGPEALVSEDDRGRITMVDEPEQQPRRGRGLAAVVIGILTAGVVVTLDLNELHSATSPGGLVATPRSAP